MINIGAPKEYAGRVGEGVITVDQESPFSPDTVKVEDVISAIETFL